jgi:hypothetical protein
LPEAILSKVRFGEFAGGNIIHRPLWRDWGDNSFVKRTSNYVSFEGAGHTHPCCQKSTTVPFLKKEKKKSF